MDIDSKASMQYAKSLTSKKAILHMVAASLEE
jgi:hypothetical protein